jgi:hypothetical protein
MKPWFIREDNVIPFPKKDTGVVKLPNINAYPDFLAGVQDLQNHLKRGDISSDIHKKLYQDLIHRFMRTESFETPWFLREAPATDTNTTGTGGIPQTKQAIDFLAKQISQLSPDTNPRILDQISRAIELAQNKSGDDSLYKNVATKLSSIDDPDMKKYYKIVSKFMLGNGLTSQEITGIIKAINDNQCVNIAELKKPSNTLANILKYYTNSVETQKYYNDLLMFQPGQRIGPGEILFATHSKELIKGTKGDLTVVATGQEIEVKGGIEYGRFRDDDILPKPTYYNKASQFEKKYKGIVPLVTSGIGYSALIQGINKDPQKSNSIMIDVEEVINDLFPANPYTGEILKAIKSGDAKKANNLHGYANLDAYFKAKTKDGGMGILFVNAKEGTATTSYAENLSQLLQAFNLDVATAYPISTVPLNPFPKIGVAPKKK